MSRTALVYFRGKAHDVIIDLDGGYEADTNAHVIEWHFCGVSPEEHEALALTDDEEHQIYEQLTALSGDDA